MYTGDDKTFVERVLAAVRARQPADVVAAWGTYTPPAARPSRTGRSVGHLTVTCQKQRIDYSVELRPRPLHGADVPRLLALKPPAGTGRFLVLAEQITQAQADQLHKGGVEFMDAAGNVYLRLPGLAWLTTGLRSKGRQPLPDRARLFRAAGIKLLFLFLGDLCRTGLPPDRRYLNRPYRDMVTAAGISFGSSSMLMRELDANGYLVPQSQVAAGGDGTIAMDSRRLDRVPELVERWGRAYGDLLRPKLVLARYRAADPLWWRTATVDHEIGLWGGEVAAAKLTAYLKPEVVTIYRQGNLTPWLLEHRLTSDPAGPVEVLDAFWHDPDIREGDCVAPLLAYADLLASDTERNLEAARVLYENRIRPCVESD